VQAPDCLTESHGNELNSPGTACQWLGPARILPVL
jgi:hypothetical protein